MRGEGETGAGTAERSRKRRRRRRILLAALAAYVALELALPYAATRLPLGTRLDLPPPLFILSEASKASLVPRDYVLVLGDSYAAGGGDWLISELGSDGNPPFQATDVLHELTGRDVITFGSAGADNVTSTAYLASKRFAQLRRTGLGEPADVLVYFYEGNDLNDNLRRARRHFGLEERGFAAFDDEALDREVAKRASKGFWRGLPGNLYALYALEMLGREAEAGEASRSLVPCAEAGEREDVVRLTAGGECRAVLDPVQGPGLELTDEELAFALRMFDRALEWVERRFPEARVTVVYLPSPVACYELLDAEVACKSYEGRAERFPAEAVRERSDRVRASVAELARARGLALVDATPALREEARARPVHGPWDANHLNRAGYEVLGALLAEALSPR